MCAEKNRDRKKRTFACCGSEGIAEMIADCCADDAGYADCLARMPGMRDRLMDRNAGEAIKENNRGCC